MASPSFSAVVKVIALYVGDAKASGLVERRLASESIPLEQFTLAHLTPTLQSRIIAVAALYLSDPGKEGDLKAKLASLAAA